MGRRGTKTGEKKREEGEEGERQKGNSEGRVVLILVDRNFRKSDRGRSKVTRWLQTHTFCQRPNQLASVYDHVSTHSSIVLFLAHNFTYVSFVSMYTLCVQDMKESSNTQAAVFFSSIKLCLSLFSCQHKVSSCPNSVAMQWTASPLALVG